MRLVLMFAVVLIAVFHQCTTLRMIAPPTIPPKCINWRRWPMWQRRIFIYGIVAPNKPGRDVERDIDENEDGLVEIQEIEQMLNERDIGDFMNSLDVNGDNLVSVDEFLKQATDS